jgi:hypothetical protein
MAAAAWDVLAKAANVAQVIAVLVAVLTSLLRVRKSHGRECSELERCTRRLQALLQWPTTGALLRSEVRDPVVKALGDAVRLVDSYKKSTLWRLVRSGGSMTTELRDMRDVLNSYCDLVIFLNAHLLLQQQAAHHHLPSADAKPTYVDV